MHVRAIAILLLCCSVSVNLSGLFVFAGFEINRDYIAKELCVNKDRAELQCKGKCYLMKKLKQAQEKEQQQESQVQKIQLQLQEAIPTLRFTFKRYPVAVTGFHIPHNDGIPVNRLTSIFHPPQLS